MATVLARQPLAPGLELWLYSGLGNPNTGLQPPAGSIGSFADPAPGSIWIQTDGLGGQQLWVKEGFGNTWQLQAPSQPQPITVTGATTLVLTQSGQVILCDATAGAFTVTLPMLSTDGACEFTIVKVDTTANAVTIGTSGTDTINNGLSTLSLAATGKAFEVYATAARWLTIGAA